MYHAGLVYVCPLLYIPRTKIKPFKIACFFFNAPGGGGGGGGYCHIWATWVCAAVKGMVFEQFTLG